MGVDMALFFDQPWFDAQLGQLGVSRNDVARLLGLTSLQVEELWKDQRELSARDVALLAQLLNQPPQVIAERAGVSTPVPEGKGGAASSMVELQERVERLETQVRQLLAEIDRLKSSHAC